MAADPAVDLAPPGEPPVRPPRTRRQQLIRLAKLLVVVGVIAALAWSVQSQWSTVSHDLARLPVVDAVAAFALALGATAVALLAWRTMLANLGSPLPPLVALHIYALSQLGKYVPGSVWPVLAQMQLGREYNVPRLRSATAFLVALMGGVISATAVGALLAFTSPGWGRAFALLPLVLLLMHPRILVPLTKLAGRILRRPELTEAPTLGGVARCLGWLVTQWLCLGVGTWLMARGLGETVDITRCVAAVALSWAAGLVVIIVPAGAGVREGVLTFLLSSSVGSGTALALALLGRLALTFADAVFALLGFVFARQARRHRPPDPGSSAAHSHA